MQKTHISPFKWNFIKQPNQYLIIEYVTSDSELSYNHVVTSACLHEIYSVDLYKAYPYFSVGSCALPVVGVEPGPLPLDRLDQVVVGVHQSETRDVHPAMLKVLQVKLVHALRRGLEKDDMIYNRPLHPIHTPPFIIYIYWEKHPLARPSLIYIPGHDKGPLTHPYPHLLTSYSPTRGRGGGTTL